MVTAKRRAASAEMPARCSIRFHMRVGISTTSPSTKSLETMVNSVASTPAACAMSGTQNSRNMASLKPKRIHPWDLPKLSSPRLCMPTKCRTSLSGHKRASSVRLGAP
eukprot:5362567-Prymnesium_polylepis.1